MTKHVGLWIDHKQAMIVILNEAGENIRQVQSNAAKHSRYHGATHPKSPYSAQYQKGDDQLDRQLAEHLAKYYDSVIEHIRGAQSLLILGPGEAKHELEKRLAHLNARPQAITIETADKMTERQFSARVRKHFQGASRPA